jgi:hypothetical protein
MHGALTRQRSAGPQEKLICDGRGANTGLSFFREEQLFAGLPGQTCVF